MVPLNRYGGGSFTNFIVLPGLSKVCHKRKVQRCVRIQTFESSLIGKVRHPGRPNLIVAPVEIIRDRARNMGKESRVYELAPPPIVQSVYTIAYNEVIFSVIVWHSDHSLKAIQGRGSKRGPHVPMRL